MTTKYVEEVWLEDDMWKFEVSLEEHDDIPYGIELVNDSGMRYMREQDLTKMIRSLQELRKRRKAG